MRRKFSIASTLLLLSVWAHMPLVSGQAAAQSTVQEFAAGDILFDAESGLLSVDIGVVPVADVLQSIAEQAGAKLTIHGDLGTTVAQRFKGIPLERGIRRLVAGEMRFGMVIVWAGGVEFRSKGSCHNCDLCPRVKSLAKVDGDGATTAFVRVLSEADDPLSRRTAALALGGLPDQDAQKALERARLDAHPTVLEAAEHALAQWQQQFGQ